MYGIDELLLQGQGRPKDASRILGLWTILINLAWVQINSIGHSNENMVNKVEHKILINELQGQRQQ